MSSRAAYNTFISQLGAATRTVNAEIKKQIIEVKAVDTGRMKNNTKVKIAFDVQKDMISIKDINSTFYFIFIDQGTRYIQARKIVDKLLKRKNVIDALDKVYDKWIDWMIEKQFDGF